MSESKHTPGRIELGGFYYPNNGNTGSCEIRQEDEFAILANVVLAGANRSGHKESQANARHFVKCWNSHDALLKACKGSPSQKSFADFALLAESFSQKPSMALHKQRFIAMATFLRRCESSAMNIETAISEAEKG